MDWPEPVGKDMGVGNTISPGPLPSVGSATSIEMYLKFAEECLREAQKMTSPESPASICIHYELCCYLVCKLNTALLSARFFIEFPRGVSCLEPCAYDELRVFQRLLRTAKEVEIVIQDCCKPAWVQVAMTMTNMSDHVSSLGFELELYAVIFSGSNQRLTSTEVHNIKIAEVEVVNEKASLDKDTLLKRVKAELGSSHGDERELCSFLLEKLKTLSEISAGSSQERISGNIVKSTRLEEDEMLGRGASATVYKARWLGMEVAKRTFYGSALATEFMKEASTLVKLATHPNVVALYDYGENRRSCFMIMELMDFDLQTMLQLVGTFSEAVSMDIMLQIARAMLFLHEHNVSHRDLKPSNVLVKVRVPDEKIYVKLADFGVAKTKATCRTFSKVDRGSSRYRAPETLRCNPMCISDDALPSKFLPASDIYSFGMTCYEILTGMIPFSAISDHSVEEIVLSGDRPQLPDDCPYSLRQLVEGCWVSDPLERPSFSEIVRKLEDLKYLELRDWVATTFQVQQQDNKSGLCPADVAISSLSIRVGYLLCEQLHPHSDGASAIGLNEGTTPIPLPDEVAFSLLGSRVGAVSTRRQQLEAGPSVIDPSKSTTPIITQEGSCYKGASVLQDLGEGTSVNGLSESSTPTQDEADSDIGTSLGGASTTQEYSEGTSVIGSTERTPPTSVSEVAGSSPCNPSVKAITLNQRQQKLGRGSSATVYKVWKDGSWVAKKVFYGLDHPDFEKEVAALKPLSHPNIMSLLGHGKEKDSCYICMELMDCDLLQLMQELLEHNCDSSPFNIEEAVRIMLQLSEAMKYLHENRVIHGDLKSPNILIKLLKNARVLPRVADFGLSKINKKSRTYSNQEVNVGTVRWMAPELIKFHSNGGDQVDMPQDCEPSLKYPYKVDVYAFAVICWEILTGERPFSKVSCNNKVKLKVLNGGRPDLPDHCPMRLKYLIERCWDDDPSKRPTFAQIVEELKQILDSIDETGTVGDVQILHVESSYTRKVIETSHTRYTSLSVACTVPCSTKGRGGYFTQVRLLIVGVLIGIFITLVGMRIPRSL